MPTLAILPLILALAPPAPVQSTTRVSVASSGLEGAGHSFTAGLSGDGRLVGFVSTAADLVAGDSNGLQDVFVHDTWTGATQRVSVSSSGAQADGHSFAPTFSHDGRLVAFRSEASNLVAGDRNGVSDVFVHDRLLGTTERVSVDPQGGDPDAWSYYQTLSRDGRFVCFQSEASNLVAGDANGTFDVFVRDRLLGTTELASVDGSGSPTGPFEFSVEPAISAGGRHVVFASVAQGLAPGASSGFIDVFLRDRQAGTTETISVAPGGQPADGGSSLPAVSADGRFVAFVSLASNLVASDTNGVHDVFVRDRELGTTERVSVSTTGIQAGLDSWLFYAHPTISSDGRFVVFESYAPELVPGDANGWSDAFLRDRLLGTTELISVASSGTQVHLGATRVTLSADAARVAFESADGHLVAGDLNGSTDVFLRWIDSACAPVVATCDAKSNSLGCLPAVGASGLPSLSGPDAFFVTASGVRSDEMGVLVVALAPGAAPFAGGTLCVAPPLFRATVQSSGGPASKPDCSGHYAFHLSQAWLAGHAIAAGTPLWLQWVSRDQGFAPPDDVGLTDALALTTCP